MPVPVLVLTPAASIALGAVLQQQGHPHLPPLFHPKLFDSNMDSAEPPCESYPCLTRYWYGSVHGAGAPVDFQARAGCPGYDPVLMGNVELLGGWEDCGQAQTLAQCSMVTSPEEKNM